MGIISFLSLESWKFWATKVFAFGFRGGDVELVGTSSALRKIEGDDIDYLHAIVRAGKFCKCKIW